MNPLHRAVDDYLELRRSLGFKLPTTARLRELVSFWRVMDLFVSLPSLRWSLPLNIRTKNR
jgi:hypothetical protein